MQRQLERAANRTACGRGREGRGASHTTCEAWLLGEVGIWGPGRKTEEAVDSPS